MLVLVDDLQWIDSASRDALSFAARRLLVARDRSSWPPHGPGCGAPSGSEPAYPSPARPIGPADCRSPARAPRRDRSAGRPDEAPRRRAWQSARPRRAPAALEKGQLAGIRAARRPDSDRELARAGARARLAPLSRRMARRAALVACRRRHRACRAPCWHALGALGVPGECARARSRPRTPGARRSPASSFVIRSCVPPPTTAPTRPQRRPPCRPRGRSDPDPRPHAPGTWWRRPWCPTSFSPRSSKRPPSARLAREVSAQPWPR